IGNSAGRTGLGAVMGAKNLKAIAVRGTRGIDIVHPETFFKLCLEAFETQKKLSPRVSTLSSAGDPDNNALVLGNFEAGRWHKQDQLQGGHEPFWRTYKNRLGDGHLGCFNCRQRCMDYYDVPEAGPLVSNCSLYANSMWILKDSDFNSWYRLASTCQKMGIDVISACRMLAWATELYENGRISDVDTNGIQLRWGNSEALHTMLDNIIHRKGLGAILASDIDTAVGSLGHDTPPPLHIKGSPLAGSNVINFRARAIGAAVNPRGGDDYRMRWYGFEVPLTEDEDEPATMGGPESWEMEAARKYLGYSQDKNNGNPKTQFDYANRGILAATSAKMSIVTDILGQCRLNTIQLKKGVGINFQARALTAGTGSHFTVEDLLKYAERTACQEKASAVKLGWTRAADDLPKALFDRRMAGAWPEDKLDPEQFRHMRAEYYQAMGWDPENGIPQLETLRGLQLSDVAAELKKQDNFR
ncbi:MAG: aldehyde ferredoxin oxidoreductase C-terminal domain-containing protein, partial [Thermodesulfobacteriota bacterium]